VQERLLELVNEESAMNRDRIEGKWRQFIGKVKENWGKLAGNPFDVHEGKRDQRDGKTQEAYGVSKEQLKKQFCIRRKLSK
jgi:uncharacterized protein YjbJ (UPF0337 family)